MQRRPSDADGRGGRHLDRDEVLATMPRAEQPVPSPGRGTRLPWNTPARTMDPPRLQPEPHGSDPKPRLRPFFRWLHGPPRPHPLPVVHASATPHGVGITGPHALPFSRAFRPPSVRIRRARRRKVAPPAPSTPRWRAISPHERRTHGSRGPPRTNAEHSGSRGPLRTNVSPSQPPRPPRPSTGHGQPRALSDRTRATAGHAAASHKRRPQASAQPREPRYAPLPARAPCRRNTSMMSPMASISSRIDGSAYPKTMPAGRSDDSPGTT